MIQDTHALRKVKSRLGGAFTWVLLFAIVAILVQSITERGFQTIMSDTAERVNQFGLLQAQAKGFGATGFGTLRLRIDIYALMQSKKDMTDKCKAVSLHTLSDRKMLCDVKHVSKGQTDCSVMLACETTFELVGDAELALELPMEFQAMSWIVSAKTWEYFDPGVSTVNEKGDGSVVPEPWSRFDTTVHATLAPPYEGAVLSGTKADPTQAVFGVTRGFADGSQVSHKVTSSGLQLGFKQTTVKSEHAQNFDPQRSHVIAFKFEVVPALHVETTTEILSTIQLAATIFSLVASATKVLKLTKRCLAKGIDAHLKKRSPLPADVKRRTELLHEDNLMHRRFQKLMTQHSLLRGPGKAPGKGDAGAEEFVAFDDDEEGEAGDGDDESSIGDTDPARADHGEEVGIEMIPVTVDADAEEEESDTAFATNAKQTPALTAANEKHTLALTSGGAGANNVKASQNEILRSRVGKLEQKNDLLLGRLADLEKIISSVTDGAWQARRKKEHEEAKMSRTEKRLNKVGGALSGDSIF